MGIIDVANQKEGKGIGVSKSQNFSIKMIHLQHALLFITQQYHLYRALYDARAMGMEASGISSSLRAYARQPYFDLREAAARVKDTLWCLFKPAPTYLGASISIFGSGDVTNDRF